MRVPAFTPQTLRGVWDETELRSSALVLEGYAADAGLDTSRVRRLGIGDQFIEQGKPDSMRAKYGIDEEGIFLAVLSFMREHTFSV